MIWHTALLPNPVIWASMVACHQCCRGWSKGGPPVQANKPCQLASGTPPAMDPAPLSLPLPVRRRSADGEGHPNHSIHSVEMKGADGNGGGGGVRGWHDGGRDMPRSGRAPPEVVPRTAVATTRYKKRCLAAPPIRSCADRVPSLLVTPVHRREGHKEVDFLSHLLPPRYPVLLATIAALTSSPPTHHTSLR